MNAWFDDIDCLPDHEKLNLYYLVGIAGDSVDQAFNILDEPRITEFDLKDVAAELFYESYLSTLPETVLFYIDYEMFARDCVSKWRHGWV